MPTNWKLEPAKVGEVYKPDNPARPIYAEPSKIGIDFVIKLDVLRKTAFCKKGQPGLTCFVPRQPEIGEAVEIIKVQKNFVKGKLIDLIE